jgi:hypothetical protein
MLQADYPKVNAEFPLFKGLSDLYRWAARDVLSGSRDCPQPNLIRSANGGMSGPPANPEGFGPPLY